MFSLDRWRSTNKDELGTVEQKAMLMFRKSRYCRNTYRCAQTISRFGIGACRQRHDREFLYSSIHNHHHVQKTAADSRLSGETAMPCQPSCAVSALPQRQEMGRPPKRPGKRLQHYAYARMPVSAATTAMIDPVQRQTRLLNTLPHRTINPLLVAHGNNAPPRSLRKSAC